MNAAVFGYQDSETCRLWGGCHGFDVGLAQDTRPGGLGLFGLLGISAVLPAIAPSRGH
jgi:hypothetical protein